MANEIEIPPFVQDYIDKIDGKGFGDFVKLSADYQQEQDSYPGKYAQQSAYLNDYNRRNGQNRQLDYQEGIDRINSEFRKKAFETARKHGYIGPDPNQPSDKEFTRQGAKFQSMIDRAKERQQEQQKPQPEQKPQADESHEKKNIETLKGQQHSYQQNTPEVEFKGAEQERSSGPDQQDREQQRAAFLEQIRKTREQIIHRQQNKEREV